MDKLFRYEVCIRLLDEILHRDDVIIPKGLREDIKMELNEYMEMKNEHLE